MQKEEAINFSPTIFPTRASSWVCSSIPCYHFPSELICRTFVPALQSYGVTQGCELPAIPDSPIITSTAASCFVGV